VELERGEGGEDGVDVVCCEPLGWTSVVIVFSVGAEA
jgi:hypothetical protein